MVLEAQRWLASNSRERKSVSTTILIQSFLAALAALILIFLLPYWHRAAA